MTLFDYIVLAVCIIFAGTFCALLVMLMRFVLKLAGRQVEGPVATIPSTESLNRQSTVASENPPAAEPARLVDVSTVKAEKPVLAICGKCKKGIRSKPLGMNISETARKQLFRCEHCGAQVSVSL